MVSLTQLDKEQIVFVDKYGRSTGQVGPKISSHTSNTKLHLAFSCYAFNSKGELLITKRAKVKRIWPNVWTNSVCGHPFPGESFEDAITRRLEYELGLPPVTELTQLVAEYTYTAPPYNGIIENEFCPIFAGVLSQEPRPNPDEVSDYKWVTLRELLQDVHQDAQDPGVYSYWMKDQLRLLMGNERFLDFTHSSK